MAIDDRAKDEGTAPAGGSNTSPQNSGAENLPEPVILEEHIVAPPPAAEPPPTAPVQVAPQPVGSPTPSLTPAAATQESLAAEVGLPPRLAPTPQEKPQTAQPLNLSDSAIPQTGKVEGDIARILEEVKLPERRDFRGGADTHPSTPIISETKSEESAVLPDESQQPEKKPKEQRIVTPLHTLKDDLQAVVRDQKISLVRAAALEEDRRARQQRAPISAEARGTRQGRVFTALTTAMILIGLGLAAIGAVAFVRGERSGSVARLPTDSLLFSEQTVPFPLSGRSTSDTKGLLADARLSAALTLGAITRVAPTLDVTDENGKAYTRLATTKEFLDALGAGAPDELVRALGNDFFFGFHTVDENAPIFVVFVSSFERAFAGMLAWEGTMNANLSPVFTAVPSLVQENGLLKQRVFADVVMRNYDVRALKDDYGEIQLYYSFPTREVLIIAESQYSFAEILSRLRADRRM